MATAAGYGGSAVWAGANANYAQNVYSWTLNLEVGEGETTDFSSTGPKTWISLTHEWSGSFVCRLDASTALPAAGQALTTITLEIASNFGYAGTCFCTGFGASQEVNGVPEVTINFRGSAALTIGAV